MKRKIILIVSVITLLVTCVGLLASCSLFEKHTDKVYTIMYTDDAGKHEISVAHGMPFVIESVPYKKGYEFLGLFDAEVGGTQYVTASGASVSPFTDKKNMVLFPQFKAKTFKVVLNYQGASATGNRELEVTYGSSLPELPKDLVLENKVFCGWYTAANCGGTQVSDQYSLVPVVSVINEMNFDLSTGYIYLYAGFEATKVTVTCLYDGMPSEEIKVDYGTSISNFVPETRNAKGEAVLTWSKHEGGEAFVGTIKEDVVLYAKEFAPVIELDTDGGNYVVPVVARAESKIRLPEPTKALSEFLYWEDMNGEKYTSNIMPSKSIKLKAVWRAKIEFNENGGSDVSDIAQSAGSTITLPMPTKNGYVFAGWFTRDNQEYTSTIMPKNGIALKAGWYKAKKDTLTILDKNTEYKPSGQSFDEVIADTLFVDLSSILDKDFSGKLSIVANMKIKFTGSSYSNTPYMMINYYSDSIMSSTYLLHTEQNYVSTSQYKNIKFTMNFALNGNAIYSSRYCNYNTSNYIVSDYYLDVTYPDTMYLYI